MPTLQERINALPEEMQAQVTALINTPGLDPGSIAAIITQFETRAQQQTQIAAQPVAQQPVSEPQETDPATGQIGDVPTVTQSEIGGDTRALAQQNRDPISDVIRSRSVRDNFAEFDADLVKLGADAQTQATTLLNEIETGAFDGDAPGLLAAMTQLQFWTGISANATDARAGNEIALANLDIALQDIETNIDQFDESFAESVRQFNAQTTLDTGAFNESIRQFDLGREDRETEIAERTRQFNVSAFGFDPASPDAPQTLEAQQLQQQFDEQQRQFNVQQFGSDPDADDGQQSLQAQQLQLQQTLAGLQGEGQPQGLPQQQFQEQQLQNLLNQFGQFQTPGQIQGGAQTLQGQQFGLQQAQLGLGAQGQQALPQQQFNLQQALAGLGPQGQLALPQQQLTEAQRQFDVLQGVGGVGAGALPRQGFNELQRQFNVLQGLGPQGQLGLPAQQFQQQGQQFGQALAEQQRQANQQFGLQAAGLLAQPGFAAVADVIGTGQIPQGLRQAGINFLDPQAILQGQGQQAFQQIPTAGALGQLTPEQGQGLQGLLNFGGVSPGSFEQLVGSVTPAAAPQDFTQPQIQDRRARKTPARRV
tara:strand:- start:3427 stop:5202 length:1776 start_codon:yes stop_codon:yes gene_type:complete